MKTNSSSGVITAIIQLIMCFAALALPLAAQSSSRLTLQQSTDLSHWQTIPVTPEMIDTNGKIVLSANAAEMFYRLQVEVIALPSPNDFALIPGGNFTMGRTSGDTDGDAPPVTVNVSEFYMAKYETTKALWDEVRVWGAANGYTDLRAGGGKAENHPVHLISWFDIVKWCNARSQKEGLTPVYTVSGAVMKTGTSVPTPNWSANGYRLPTEAEWEKAARGGESGQRFPWGNGITHFQANYVSYTSESYDVNLGLGYHPIYQGVPTPYSSPVGSFAPNGYGLYDTAGNMWEWCWDWYERSTYVNGASDPRGATSGTYRVIRGGSWFNGAKHCRSASRNSNAPSRTINIFGFRIARNLAP